MNSINEFQVKAPFNRVSDTSRSRRPAGLVLSILSRISHDIAGPIFPARLLLESRQGSPIIDRGPKPGDTFHSRDQGGSASNIAERLSTYVIHFVPRIVGFRSTTLVLEIPDAMI